MRRLEGRGKKLWITLWRTIEVSDRNLSKCRLTGSNQPSLCRSRPTTLLTIKSVGDSLRCKQREKKSDYHYYINILISRVGLTGVLLRLLKLAKLQILNLFCGFKVLPSRKGDCVLDYVLYRLNRCALFSLRAVRFLQDLVWSRILTWAIIYLKRISSFNF